jgi:hypothetical protein
MDNITDCERRVLSEALDDQGQVIYTIKTAKDASTACIHILDLTTLHPNAKGFRKGFLGYPYGYLSPGQFNVPVRLNLVNFTLSTASYIDLGNVMMIMMLMMVVLVLMVVMIIIVINMTMIQIEIMMVIIAVAVVVVACTRSVCTDR